MPLTFASIPTTIRTPGSFVEFDNTNAQPSLQPMPTAILLLGQGLPSGIAHNLVPRMIVRPLEGQLLFGRGSMLDRMCQAAWAVNTTTPIWAMAVADNAAGVADVTPLTFGGVGANTAGTLNLYIAGQLVQTAVNVGDTPATVATNVGAAINANPDLPVTAVVAGPVVTCTCAWKGESGKGIDYRLNYYQGDVTPGGITMAVGAGVDGTGNPDASAVVAAFGDTWWNSIASPWTDAANLAVLTAEMADRRGPLEMIDGIIYASAKGTLGTLAAIGQAQNSPDLSISECVGPATPWERAAREAALINFYGFLDPPRPLQTLALTGDTAGQPFERFSATDRDILLHDGISTHTVDSGGNLLLERPITTYQMDGNGVPDASYLDVTTLMTLSYLRYTLRLRIATKYPRYKLADDGIAVAPGQAIVTPKLLTAELVALARDWETAGLVDDVDAFKSQFVVQRNAADPSRIDAIVPPKIVSGLREFSASIAFTF